MAHPIQQGLFKYDLSDYHAILGVPIGADVQQVRQRYLRIAQRLHPDTCKAKGEAERKQASELLSKWVNPAYEKLSKARSRNDYLLVLTQMSKTLTAEATKITLASQVAIELMQAGDDLELTYHKLLQPFVPEQYTDLDKVLQQIGQISELNLVYLMRAEGQKSHFKTQPGIKVPTSSSEKPPEKKEDTVPLARYLRRARESLARENLTQALLELRDALKINPNDSTCHSLLGLTYLKENQLTMAKVHINKAYQLNPKDPNAILAKEELKKLLPEEEETKKNGLFGGFFSKKKG